MKNVIKRWKRYKKYKEQYLRLGLCRKYLMSQFEYAVAETKWYKWFWGKIL